MDASISSGVKAVVVGDAFRSPLMSWQELSSSAEGLNRYHA